MDDYDVHRRVKLIFSELLQDVSLSEKKVLEVGCGTGRISHCIKDENANLTVVDIGEQLVKNVSEGLCCEGVAADACSLPFENDSFDVVISSECIEWYGLEPHRPARGETGPNAEIDTPGCEFVQSSQCIGSNRFDTIGGDQHAGAQANTAGGLRR